MQTILGATGQIAVELARELRRHHTGDLRLVSRSPRKVHDADVLVPADLLDARQAHEAVKGSDIVWFTAFGQTWHLPCPDGHLTYRQFVTLAAEVFGVPLRYRVIGRWALAAAGLVSKQVRELRELLPRYEHDNLFDSTKFKRRFPTFEVTGYRQGLELIRAERAPAVPR